MRVITRRQPTGAFESGVRSAASVAPIAGAGLEWGRDAIQHSRLHQGTLMTGTKVTCFG